MLGEADAKFPGQEGGGLPPSPSAVNPGQVYPKSSLHAAPAGSIPGSGNEPGTSCIIGNPYLFEDALQKLENSLDNLIQIIGSEQKATGYSEEATSLLEKFEGWREELRAVHADRLPGSYPERPQSGASGGLFVD
ncbi:hypothetical protein F5J12DRAFT_842016 [Pisolithus orientalis]|uniref:uncharacterized protein n=1 Tax=Pisolithus orientalis TaxID=936130 RepID=UPI0022255F14|nr:uncharacterized protein F5J12DRAFT_842016 [Pisolithus orientalis]KAI6002261.1 hypothetical protein F5J12DRAFT_842016 [Pisolithus orientalis]